MAAVADRNSTEPEHTLPRYALLGEEGDEDLLIYGHAITEDSIRGAITEAGFGRIFGDLVIDGHKIADGTTVAELYQFETWAREMHGCPRHRWLPLRRALVSSVEWVRYQCFQVTWRLWQSKQDPLRERWVPAWLRWLGTGWRGLAYCQACEYVDHYRSCSGCGYCDSDGTGTAPPWWDWATPDGAPADVNAGRAGYVPVTIIDLAG